MKPQNIAAIGGTLIFEFKPSFSEQYRACFEVMFRLPFQLILMSLFPLASLALLFVIILIGKPLEIGDVIAIIAGLAFAPGITALNIWLRRRKNKTVQGVHRYTVSDSGFSISNPAFNIDLKWHAINRVRETSHYFLFFISASCAYFIPKAVVGERAEELREIVKAGLVNKSWQVNSAEKI
jgi:hypothetical protein